MKSALSSNTSVIREVTLSDAADTPRDTAPPFGTTKSYSTAWRSRELAPDASLTSFNFVPLVKNLSGLLSD